MACNASKVAYIVAQMRSAGPITARKMFGEYAIYCDRRLVALVCFDSLYMRSTVAGRAFVGHSAGPPDDAPGDPYFFIPGQRCDDGGWLSRLVTITAAERTRSVKTSSFTATK